MIKRFVVFLALVALLGPASLAVGPTVEAQGGSASEAVKFCRFLDEQGQLEGTGLTRGECVNLLKGPSSENATNFIAAICGFEGFQEFTNTTNKGQCIKVVRSLLNENGNENTP